MKLVNTLTYLSVFSSIFDGLAARQLKASQLGQDAWVLSVFNRPRFYLDVGSNDGEELSNTKALDDAGWQGICVDPFPRNFEGRTCTMHKHPVAASKQNATFVDAGVFGGLEKHVGPHKDRVKDHLRVELETKLLHELLDESKAPPFIDYFSLDTEGSEAEILMSFPFWKYRFGAITVEHNFEEPKRSEMRAILGRNGYSLFKSVDFDDWYLKDDYIPAISVADKPATSPSEKSKRVLYRLQKATSVGSP